MAALETAAPAETFGQQLRRLRARAGYSQGRLGDAAGVACSTVSDLECGRHRPVPETAQRLALVLCQTPDEAHALLAPAGPRQRTMRRRAAAGPFGVLLAAHRGAASQSEVARLAGLEGSFISRLESGEQRPGRETVERIAAGLDLDDLERDRLLVAAGFVPSWVETAYAEWSGAAIRRLMARAERGE